MDDLTSDTSPGRVGGKNVIVTPEEAADDATYGQAQEEVRKPGEVVHTQGVADWPR